MATAAQITANRLNAMLSTGPKMEAGKAAVAQNHLSHRLSSKNFAYLVTAINVPVLRNKSNLARSTKC
jgi:hypothetical protein